MSKHITKLLCPTDGSHAAKKGVEFAVNFAENFSNIEVIFLHVSRETTDASIESRYSSSELKTAAEIQGNMECEAAADCAKNAKLKKYKCVKTSAGGNIAAAILAYAEKEKCDHIVMGSTGLTGVARILLGSVASEVVAKAHCPVTVIR